MREEHERVLEQLRGIAAVKDAEQQGEEPGSPRMTLEWGIAYQEFVIDWCKQMERRLARETAVKEA
jgi:hypothetical protein